MENIRNSLVLHGVKSEDHASRPAIVKNVSSRPIDSDRPLWKMWHAPLITSTDWKERKKNKSREEICYQMKVFFC